MINLNGLITSDEAQELTGYHPDHLRRLARGGQVQARLIGRTWLFDRADLLKHKAEAKPGPKPAEMPE